MTQSSLNNRPGLLPKVLRVWVFLAGLSAFLLGLVFLVESKPTPNTGSQVSGGQEIAAEETPPSEPQQQIIPKEDPQQETNTQAGAEAGEQEVPTAQEESTDTRVAESHAEQTPPTAEPDQPTQNESLPLQETPKGIRKTGVRKGPLLAPPKGPAPTPKTEPDEKSGLVDKI